MNDWVGFGHSAILMLIFELPAVGRTLWRKSYRLPADFAIVSLVTKCFLLKKPTQEAAGHMQVLAQIVGAVSPIPTHPQQAALTVAFTPRLGMPVPWCCATKSQGHRLYFIEPQETVRD